MGLTLSEETSNRVSEVVLPPRLGRNEACHCGSGSKYKRCCWERDEALRLYLLPLPQRSEEHTSELQSRRDLVCRLLLEKKKQQNQHPGYSYPVDNRRL